MRLRNIGWLVCAGTSLTALPVSLRFSSVASPPSLFALVRRFPHALSTHRLNLPPSLSFTLAISLSLSSLPSTVPPFSSFLSSINPQPSFSFSPSPPPPAYPQHVHARAVERAIHTCTRAHVHTAPRFLLVAANTLRQRGRPLLVQKGAKGRGCGWQRRYDFTQLPWPRHFFPI